MKAKILGVLLFGVALSFGALSEAEQTINPVYAESAYTVVSNNNCPKLKSDTSYDQYVNTGEIDGLTWRVNGITNYDGGWRFGGKSLDNKVRNVYTTTPVNSSVDKITFTTGTISITDLKINEITLKVYSDYQDGTLSGEIDSITATFKAQSDIDFINPGTNDWNGKYFEFQLPFTNESTSNGYLKVTSIVLYKVVENGFVELDQSSISLNVSRTATLTANTTSNVEWSAEPADVVEIQTSGELNNVAVLTGLKEGEVTVTASIGSATATCNVVVTKLINKFEEITSLEDINLGDIIAIAFKEPGVIITDFVTNQLVSSAALIDGVIAEEYKSFQIVKGYTDNTYAFLDADEKYLGINDAVLKLTRTLDENTSWTISFTDDVINIVTTSTNQTSVGRKIAWRTTHNYARAYATYDATWKAPTLYKYVDYSASEISEAESFATAFLSALRAEGVCDPNGVNTDLSKVQDVWKQYQAKYKALSEGAKAYIASVSDGVNSSSDLESLVTIYNYILNKYNEAGLVDFMHKQTIRSSINHSLTRIENANFNVYFVIGILITVLTLSVLILKKKSRFNKK